jgi:hypothetical protein
VSTAVRHGFDQDRTIFSQCDPARLLGGTVHGARISTIHTDGRDAVCGTSASNAITCTSQQRRWPRTLRLHSAVYCCDGPGCQETWQQYLGTEKGKVLCTLTLVLLICRRADGIAIIPARHDMSTAQSQNNNCTCTASLASLAAFPSHMQAAAQLMTPAVGHKRFWIAVAGRLSVVHGYLICMLSASPGHSCYYCSAGLGLTCR